MEGEQVGEACLENRSSATPFRHMEVRSQLMMMSLPARRPVRTPQVLHLNELEILLNQPLNRNIQASMAGLAVWHTGLLLADKGLVGWQNLMWGSSTLQSAQFIVGMCAVSLSGP